MDNYQTQSLKSNKTGRLHEYIQINTLPSGFRNYCNRDIPITKVLVRGLVYSEMVSLKKLPTVDLEQMKLIYQDVIVFPEDSGMTLGDLELIDFLTLVTLVTIYTVRDFRWDYKGYCPSCKMPLATTLGIQDVNFNVNTFRALPLDLNLTVGGESKTYKLRVLTVDDIIRLKALKLDQDIERMYEVASSLSPDTQEVSDEGFQKILHEVFNMEYSDITMINSVIMELTPGMPYFTIECSNPRCRSTSQIEFNMDVLNITPDKPLRDLYELKYLWQRSFNSALNTEDLYSDIIEMLKIHNEYVEASKGK